MLFVGAPVLPGPPLVVKITYNMSTLSTAEMKKKKNARQPLSHFIELASDMEWMDVKDKLLILIIDALNLESSSYNDHNILFTVPRYVPGNLPLKSDTDYSYLVKNAMKAKTDPSVKIFVTQNLTSARNLSFSVRTY
jgi:hypothetical protein